MSGGQCTTTSAAAGLKKTYFRPFVYGSKRELIARHNRPSLCAIRNLLKSVVRLHRLRWLFSFEQSPAYTGPHRARPALMQAPVDATALSHRDRVEKVGQGERVDHD